MCVYTYIYVYILTDPGEEELEGDERHRGAYIL